MTFKDIKNNMLQVLQWCRESKHFIRGETIANYWIKSSILPVLHENELKGEGKRKKKVGAAKFKNKVNELTTDLASLGLGDMPSMESLVNGLDCEIFDDPGKVSGNDKEECESMNDIFTEEEDVDNELHLIPLTKVKEYSTALHHFVINNLDQPQLFDFADAFYKMVQVVHMIVESSAKLQQNMSSFFLLLTLTNNEDKHE